MRWASIGVLLSIVASGASWAAETLSLDGAWKLESFPQPAEGVIRSLPLPRGIVTRKYAASVPGCCEWDVYRAGDLPDPVVSTNSMAWWRLEENEWLYSKTFLAPLLDSGERAVLVFEGIDTLADVFLNGVKIGETDNMFIAHEFDVTNDIRAGKENLLQVLIRPLTLAARDVTLGELGGSMGGGATHEHFRKAAYMYGWDIMPHFAVNGIWKGVRLEMRGERIDQVAWIPLSVNATERTAKMVVRCRVQAPFSRYYHSRVRATLTRNGKTLDTVSVPLNGPFSKLYFWKLKDVDLWWPKDAGEPALYEASLEAMDESGLVFARDVRRIGIRTVSLEYEDKTSEANVGKMLFRVNGEPIYIRGINWTPLDPIPAHHVTRLPWALGRLGELGCNLVRVWGGGVYEPEAFFDWCDENGVMVWQDMMMGCAVPPMDDDFAAAIRKETLAVVLRLRNHPSLVLWAGDNENDMARRWSVHELARDPNKNRINRDVIPAVLHEYDVTRPYLPSSPYWSPAAIRGETRPCEDHLWADDRGWWKTDYITNSCAFCSEGGAHGMPSMVTLEKMLTPTELAKPFENPEEKDPDKVRWTRSWVFRSTNPYLDMDSYLVARNNVILKQVHELFGEFPTGDVETLIDMSQAAQAERNKFQIEYFRSHKFAGKYGFALWNLTDGWAQLSDAISDYFGNKKKTFDIASIAMTAVLPVVGEDRQLRICNDTLVAQKGQIRILDAATGRVVVDRDYSVAANAVETVAHVDWQGQGVFRIEWTFDGRMHVSHYLYGDRPFAWKDYARWMKCLDQPSGDMMFK